MGATINDIRQQRKGKFSIFLFWQLALVTEVICGLHPYYISIPHPPPFIPIPNGIDSDFPYSAWPQNGNSNSTPTRGGNLPSGPIPLIVHTWVKPADNTEGTKLENGTVVYYLGGPWGGIRSSAPAVSDNLNSIPQSTGSGYAASPGWGPPTIDITTSSPLPNRQQDGGPWGHGHFGFGWPTSTQLYDKLPETTTTAATRNQVNLNTSTKLTTTSTTESSTKVTTGAAVTSRAETSSTSTIDPIASSIDSRYPVSDSVRKFRRIVAQIRAIAKKELGTTTTRRSRRLSQSK